MLAKSFLVHPSNAIGTSFTQNNFIFDLGRFALKPIIVSFLTSKARGSLGAGYYLSASDPKLSCLLGSKRQVASFAHDARKLSSSTQSGSIDPYLQTGTEHFFF